MEVIMKKGMYVLKKLLFQEAKKFHYLNKNWILLAHIEGIIIYLSIWNANTKYWFSSCVNIDPRKKGIDIY